MSSNLRILSLVIFLSVTVLGCSSETSRYAATGTVNMDGAPAPYVIVSFHSVVPGSSPGGSGPTDLTGKFAIGENGKNTGLPSGDYKVTFTQTLVRGKPTLSGSGGKAAEKETTEKEAVADDFRNPEISPIAASIGNGANNFTFDIKSKK